MNKLSYAFGIAMAQQVKGMGIADLDLADFRKAFETVYGGGEPELSMDEAQKVINEYLTELQEKSMKAAREAGNAFLADNASKEGVKVTPSGLQYKVEKEGTGASPKAEDNVTVHYTGRLIDGTVFDSSVNRGEPATFPLNRVIPGWTEGLQLMKEGAKYVFFIPSDLAYGPQGVPNAIPPHSTLIFEVELIKVGG